MSNKRGLAMTDGDRKLIRIVQVRMFVSDFDEVVKKLSELTPAKKKKGAS